MMRADDAHAMAARLEQARHAISFGAGARASRRRHELAASGFGRGELFQPPQ